jgi:hypothetical protein
LYVSAQIGSWEVASISWSEMRRRWPDFRTLPSRIDRTPSSLPISRIDFGVDDPQVGDLRERADQLLRQAVREVLVGRVGADVGERKDRDPVPGRTLGDRRGLGFIREERDPVGLDRKVEVLERPRPEVFESVRELVAHRVEHFGRDADPARERERLDAGGDVHGVAEDVRPPLLHIPEVDPDPDDDGGDAASGVTLEQLPLDVDGALDRPQGAAELDQEPVAGRLDLAALVRGDDRSNERFLLAQQAKGAGFIRLRGRGETDHVGEHDGGEPTRSGHRP